MDNNSQKGSILVLDYNKMGYHTSFPTDIANSGLVERLRYEGYEVSHIDGDHAVLEVLRDPKGGPMHDLALYDTRSAGDNLSVEERISRFFSERVAQLSAREYPIIVLADEQIAKSIRYEALKAGFVQINLPYNLEEVVQKAGLIISRKKGTYKERYLGRHL